ncbi:MAG: Glyoxalase family protein [uncultured Gemmatimonadetes bacterium]|uniref:Glyoxalase family protein n=1 Tax=uncultured Gemmatimonadota bacterium TaxID=203437 RepID=A0A6J4MRB0_9BACT|nr:MAG: Glyoxalase family protein [uncultured Gemmatimonadota bacterium]
MNDREYGIAPPGYRLPDATRLGRVRLQVADLDRSLGFYQGLVGLRLLRREDGMAELGAPESDEVLVELRERPGVRPVPYRGLIGLYHFAILLPDRASLGRFLRHLGASGVRAGMSDHLVSEALYLTDPDGLGLEVYADRPRSTWLHHEGQLAMTTAPLDIRDVLAAGGDQPWSGVPAGTVIGHVHLYVDDIEAGAAFYHERIGFDKVVWSYPGALFVSAGGYHHHLGMNSWAAGSPVATDEDARLLEWEIVAPGAESSVVHDPWGTAVRIRG